MADNFSIKDSLGVDHNVSTKDIGGVHFPKVILYDASGNVITSWTVNGTVTTTPPTDATTNISKINGVTPLMGAGNTGTGSPRVTIASDQVAVPVTVTGSTLAAAQATTDAITAKLATDAIMNGLVALTPKFAKIAVSASGDNTVVAAVTSKKIRVLAYILSASGSVNAKWVSGTTGTDVTGLKYCAATTLVPAPFNPAGWLETASGVLLNLNLSAAIAVGGELVYVEV